MHSMHVSHYSGGFVRTTLAHPLNAGVLQFVELHLDVAPLADFFLSKAEAMRGVALYRDLSKRWWWVLLSVSSISM